MYISQITKLSLSNITSSVSCGFFKQCNLICVKFAAAFVALLDDLRLEFNVAQFKLITLISHWIYQLPVSMLLFFRDAGPCECAVSIGFYCKLKVIGTNYFKLCDRTRI